MIVLKPSTDELIGSYIYRLTAVNGFKDRKAALYYFANRSGLLCDLDIVRSPQIIAALLHTSSLEIIKRHTMLSFTSLMPGPTGTFDLRTNSDKLFLAAGKHLSKDLNYCRTCAQEEFDKTGWSSYKRHHQLDHISYCQIHRGQQLLTNQPSSWDVWMPHLPANEKVPYKIRARSKMGLSAQKTFHSYWSALEQSTNFIDGDLLRLFLVSTARNQGFQTTPVDQHTRIFSDHILDTYEPGLFEEVYPAGVKKTRGVLFDPMDGYLIYGYRSAVKITLILPIMIGLFESAEKLIEEFEIFKSRL